MRGSAYGVGDLRTVRRISWTPSLVSQEARFLAAERRYHVDLPSRAQGTKSDLASIGRKTGLVFVLLASSQPHGAATRHLLHPYVEAAIPCPVRGVCEQLSVRRKDGIRSQAGI